MKIVLFYHSLLSDWNHGNAHFLRGIASELIRQGHAVTVYEPEHNWSLTNLLKDAGPSPLQEMKRYYPSLQTRFYAPDVIDLDAVLGDADLVIVHEWNDHDLVKAIGQKKQALGYKLLFHDTHHRAVSEKSSMQRYDLSNYDGVLAFGEVIRQIYLKEGWAARAWTWHEAADTTVFHPYPSGEKDGDLVWIGNWGDEERTKELHEFLIEPVAELKLNARIFGVRYPDHARCSLHQAGIRYGGWLANFKAPEIFARYRFTVHVPRRPYVETLPGIPTIRPFEAMACGIPLISAPWQDAEQLFTPGKDFLVAHNGKEMKKLMQTVLHEPELVSELTAHALHTIQTKHTCAHRVDELLRICTEIGLPVHAQTQIA